MRLFLFFLIFQRTVEDLGETYIDEASFSNTCFPVALRYVGSTLPTCLKDFSVSHTFLFPASIMAFSSYT